MTYFKMDDRNYYDNAETARNRWFDTTESQRQNTDAEGGLNDNPKKSNRRKETPTSGDGLKTSAVKQKDYDNIAQNNSPISDTWYDVNYNGSDEKPLKRTLSQSISMRKRGGKDADNNLADRRHADKESASINDLTDEQNKEEYEAWHYEARQSMNSDTVKALTSIYCGVLSQYERLRMLLPRLNDHNLSRLLFSAMENNARTLAELEEIALCRRFENEVNIAETAKTSSVSRLFGRTGMRLKLIGDASPSSVARALIMSTTAHVLEIGKRLRNHSGISADIRELASRHIEFEEGITSRLKRFL